MLFKQYPRPSEAQDSQPTPRISKVYFIVELLLEQEFNEPLTTTISQLKELRSLTLQISLSSVQRSQLYKKPFINSPKSLKNIKKLWDPNLDIILPQLN